MDDEDENEILSRWPFPRLPLPAAVRPERHCREGFKDAGVTDVQHTTP